MNQQDVQNYVNSLEVEVVEALTMEDEKAKLIEPLAKTNKELVWNLTICDQLRFLRIFQEISLDKIHVTLDQVEQYTNLKELELFDIWCLCNPDYTNTLNIEQFTVFLWLFHEKQKGKSLPATLRNITPKMPERYAAAIKCSKQPSECELVKEPLTPSLIDAAVKTMQAKLDRLNEAVNKHKQNCDETKQILESLKTQTESMLKSLYKREVCITNEQIENDAEALKLQQSKEEIISLQHDCATSVFIMRAKFHELEVVEDKIEHLINEAKELVGIVDFNDNSLINGGTSSNPFASESESKALLSLHNSDLVPLLDLTFDSEE